MTFQKDCDELLHTLNDAMPYFTPEKVISLIDLTLLDESAPEDQVLTLREKAIEHQVAAICVYHKHLYYFDEVNPVKRASVVNFPEGKDSETEVLSLIEHFIDIHHLDEIDFVFSYMQYLEGERKKALDLTYKACQLAKQGNAQFKIILETGALPSPDCIYQLSQECINMGTDFLKTSTGKIPVGATQLAAFTMLQAIKHESAKCGLKVSGGIKEIQHAHQYIALAEHMLGIEANKSWFRIGASSLLDSLTK